MQFKEFNFQLQYHVENMLEGQNVLYVVDIDKDIMWNAYLDSFPAGTNMVYRKRREYDCGCCRNFIQSFGNVVIIKSDCTVESIWKFRVDDPTFQTVIDAMDELITSKPIANMLVTDKTKFGTRLNLEIDNGIVREWHHFHLEIPAKFKNANIDRDPSVLGKYQEGFTMLKRAISDISLDAVDTVLELVQERLIDRGDEFVSIVREFRNVLVEHNQYQTATQRDNMCWRLVNKPVLCRIRNLAIGTLLVNITSGMDINDAVRAYHSVVSPENYRRSAPIFTQKMIDSAQKTIAELGLENSLSRRFANLHDISVKDVLWVNRSIQSAMKDGLAGLTPTAQKQVKSFDNVPVLTMEQFIAQLGTFNKIRMYANPELAPHLVSLITATDSTSKPLFKWGNNTSWAYTGNLADSSMRTAVKKAGGRIDGALRFSISWEKNPDDLDAHCDCPTGHIYYASKIDSKSMGQLDVDITSPNWNSLAVENIIFPELRLMKTGNYAFYVYNYCNRGSNNGFKAEIEFNNTIYQFEYLPALRHGQRIEVATVKFDGTKLSITPSLNPVVLTKDMWGLTPNEFHDVTVVTMSPNMWDAKVGNPHYIFAINGCINPDTPNGFFNEYLPNELTPHRKVLEALGSHMKVEHSTDQVSGFGFTITKPAEIVFQVESNQMTRLIKVKI